MIDSSELGILNQQFIKGLFSKRSPDVKVATNSPVEVVPATPIENKSVQYTRKLQEMFLPFGLHIDSSLASRLPVEVEILITRQLSQAEQFLNNNEIRAQIPALSEYTKASRVQQEQLMLILSEIENLSLDYNSSHNQQLLRDLSDKNINFVAAYKSFFPNDNLAEHTLSAEVAEKYARMFPAITLARFALGNYEQEKFLLSNSLTVMEEDNKLPQSEDFLIHGISAASPENRRNYDLREKDDEKYFNESPIVSLIRNGKLLSRIEQNKANGRNNYNTVSHLKQESSETHDISFGENFGYDSGEGANDFFYIVLDKKYVMSTSSFYKGDGLHVFDKEHEGPSSQGKSVDLKKDPALLVISKRYEEWIKRTIDRHFSGIEAYSLWDGMTQDEANEWVSQQVVIAEPISKVADQAYESHREFLSKLNTTYRNAYSITIEPGHFIPTGVVESNAGGVPGGQAHLTTYQSEVPIVERRRINAQSIWNG